MSNKLNIFISWSGEQSKETAEVFGEYIKFVINDVNIFMSSELEKGITWFDAISSNLEGSNYGLICIAKENLDANWIYYEAGALSKHRKNARVCVFSLNVGNSALESPLSQFQTTKNEKADIYKLFVDINNTLGDEKTDEATFNSRFEKCGWTWKKGLN